MSFADSQQTPYDVLSLDLTNARANVQLVPGGRAIRQVLVALLPAASGTAATDFRVGYGVAKPFVPVTQGVSATFFLPLVDGLYCTHPAQAGVTCVLYISYAQL